MKNFSDFPSKILDIIFLRCDNKTVERFQTSHNFINGLVAQLGAHHIRIVGVVGSNPIRSTKTGNRRSENCGDFSFDHRNTTDGFLL